MSYEDEISYFYCIQEEQVCLKRLRGFPSSTSVRRAKYCHFLAHVIPYHKQIRSIWTKIFIKLGNQ